VAEPEYMDRLAQALDSGKAAELVREHGDHLVKLGSKSTVYVLERLGE
jgi:hypothetical protein